MNQPIIIQGAMQSEINYLIKNFTINNIKHIGNFIFYECEHKNYPVVISKTKIGEISSAIATTLAIKEYNPLLIINQGTAGALVDWLDKEDFVIGEQIYYISQYSTEKNILDNNPWGKIEYRTSDDETMSYKADEKFIDYLKKLSVVNKQNIYFDIIASGDIWTKNVDQIRMYNNEYNVVCEAMECSGAYFAANSFNIPVASIRVISNNEIKNQDFDESIGILSQKLTINILDEIINDIYKLNQSYIKLLLHK